VSNNNRKLFEVSDADLCRSRIWHGVNRAPHKILRHEDYINGSRRYGRPGANCYDLQDYLINVRSERVWGKEDYHD
jgi:hypothetical protein